MKRAIFAALAQTGGLQRRIGPFSRDLRILAYHGLWITPGMAFGDRLFIAPEQFEARMRRLATGPYALLGLDEAVTRLATGTLPRWPVVVTIDDGWATTHSHMLPILERWRIPATVYVTSWHVERQVPITNVAIRYVLTTTRRPPSEWEGVSIDAAHPDAPATVAAVGARVKASRDPGERLAALVAFSAAMAIDPASWMDNRQFHVMNATEVAACPRRGLDVQLHTHRHRGMMAADTIEDEVRANAAVLGPLVGAGRLHHFCYPSGNYISDAGRVLAGLGVRSATTTVEGLNRAGADPYFLRRFLDGRSVGAGEFAAYLSGGLELAARLRPR